MELVDKLNSLASKVKQQVDSIKTEEATKTAFVMPFINSVLGYDVFNPLEVIPEYVCDVGTKKGEKIDYAIMRDNTVQILIECKKIGEPLNLNHASQLFRYFHTTTARISILTNGQVYKFFTDLDSPNKMDEKPFLEVDLLNLDEYTVPDLQKLTKGTFDIDSIINSASELKYIGQIKRIIASQFIEPDEEFTRFFISRVYDGIITAKIREQFIPLVTKAISQYKNDLVNDRLKSAITGFTPAVDALSPPQQQEQQESAAAKQTRADKVVTTEEEMEGFFIVKSIVRTLVDPSRVIHRDTQSYFGILLDDNNRKPICRLHFNGSQKYVGLLDDNKKETRHPIDNLDDIYQLSTQIQAALKLVL